MFTLVLIIVVNRADSGVAVHVERFCFNTRQKAELAQEVLENSDIETPSTRISFAIVENAAP
jgi:hypothetical protein